MFVFLILVAILSLSIYTIWFFDCIKNNSPRHIVKNGLTKFNKCFFIGELNNHNKETQYYLYIEREFLFLSFKFRYQTKIFINQATCETAYEAKVFNSKEEVEKTIKEMKEKCESRIDLLTVLESKILCKISKTKNIKPFQ